jgi:hypothetical protein
MISTLGYLPPTTPHSTDAKGIDAEIVEVALLLPRWQILALESVAEERGLTTAQMLRRMIGETISKQSSASIKH